MNSSVRRRPILEPAELRRLAFGHGLLLLRSASPIMLRLQPWTDRPDGVMLAAARDRFEQPPSAEADDA
jgi:type IV secretory pathway TraG/TraD family ATPase VirD4